LPRAIRAWTSGVRRRVATALTHVSRDRHAAMHPGCDLRIGRLIDPDLSWPPRMCLMKVNQLVQ